MCCLTSLKQLTHKNTVMYSSNYNQRVNHNRSLSTATNSFIHWLLSRNVMTTTTALSIIIIIIITKFSFGQHDDSLFSAKCHNPHILCIPATLSCLNQYEVTAPKISPVSLTVHRWCKHPHDTSCHLLLYTVYMTKMIKNIIIIKNTP